MKLGIMQPYFFPYLAYWQLINAVDKYVIYDDVAYIKGGWINRNNILLNGNSHLITIPLEGASSFLNINEILITKNKRLLEKLVKTIEFTYSKAPYYKIIMPILEKLILGSSTISHLNYNSVIEINKYLDIETEIILSSELKKNNDLKGQDKVIHINKLLESNQYINAIGGQELYNKNDFEKENIELKFIKMKDIKYKQFSDKFIPNLSIIDVLMFNDKETIKELLNEYELV